MSFFRIVWAWICVLITFLARNAYFIIIIFVQWMLTTFSSLVRLTYWISDMVVATEAAASALTTQQACCNREASLLLMCSLRRTHSSHLACRPSTAGIWMSLTTVVPENGYGRPPEQAWSTQKHSWAQWGLLGQTERVFGMITRWRSIFAEFPWSESNICCGGCCVLCPLTMTVEKLCWKSVSRHVNGHTVRSFLMSRGCATCGARLYVIIQVPL